MKFWSGVLTGIAFCGVCALGVGYAVYKSRTKDDCDCECDCYGDCDECPHKDECDADFGDYENLEKDCLDDQPDSKVEASSEE